MFYFLTNYQLSVFQIDLNMIRNSWMEVLASLKVFRIFCIAKTRNYERVVSRIELSAHKILQELD